MDRDNWNIKDEMDESALFGSSIFGDDDEIDDLVLEDEMPRSAEEALEAKAKLSQQKKKGDKSSKNAKSGDDEFDFNGEAEKLAEDQQGRVRLSKELCSCASIEKDMVFVGKGTYLELWSAEVWDERYSILNKSNLDKVLDNLKKHGV